MTLPPSPRSQRRAYLDWIEEQIEAYKDTISRSDLLRLADEVVAELAVTRRGQYQLTEMVLCDAVDRRIFRMLRLPSYKTWTKRLAESDGAADGGPSGNGTGPTPIRDE
jgi:hypothetical protein